MKIRMSDGRVFEGTALQVVQEMRATAFTPREMSVPEYVRWVWERTIEATGRELQVADGTEEQMAADLVAELVRVGLAETFRA